MKVPPQEVVEEEDDTRVRELECGVSRSTLSDVTLGSNAPWLLSKEEAAEEANELEEYLPVLRGAELRRECERYCQGKHLIHVYSSATMERTLPSEVLGTVTFTIFDSIVSGCPTDVAANLSSEEHSKLRSALVAHVNAVKFVEDNAAQPVSVGFIKAVHACLFSHDRSMEPGEFRTQRAQVLRIRHRVHEYSSPDRVPAEVEAAVRRFNRAAKTSVPEMVCASTRFFYDLVSTHPFKDGNGRLCRLIIAHAWYAFGLPFPLTLSSGHRRARGHHLNALYVPQDGRYEDTERNLAKLRDIVLISAHWDARQCMNTYKRAKAEREEA